MAGPVLDPQTGLAYVYDRLTGQVLNWRVPTAIENVDRNPDRYGHGRACPAGERISVDPTVGRAAAEPLSAGMNNGAMAEDGTLDMPREPDPLVAMLTASNEQLRAENAELVTRQQGHETDIANLRDQLAAITGDQTSTQDAAEALGGHGAEGEAKAPTTPTPRPKAPASAGKKKAKAAVQPANDPERTDIITQLKSREVRFFSGATTEQLKAKLAASE